MKRLLKFERGLFLMSIMLTSITYIKGQTLPPTDPLYDSVFVENFGSSTLNTSKWQTHYNWGTFFNKDTVHCWSNQALFYLHGLNFNPLDTVNRKINKNGNGTCQLIATEYYDSSQVWTYPLNCTLPECQGFDCFLDTVAPDSVTSRCFKPVNKFFRYRSAMLQTKKEFKYGFFETRFRFPGWTASPYAAYHPSFWMFNSSTTVPWSEIDIFELYGTSGRITDAIHVDAVADTFKIPTDDPIPDPPGEDTIDLAQWHTMSCHWTADYIDFYVDRVFIRRSIADTNQYLLPMPLILENQINLWFGCVAIDSANTPFPFTMELDYVKVWQPKLACSLDTTYCNVNASTFKNKLYKSLTIGGSGCAASFNNSISTAVATDYVLLQEGFEVGNNMEILINTDDCWNGMQAIDNNNTNPTPPPTDFEIIYKETHNPN